MRLSRHSEVALRALIYLAAQPRRLTSISDIARSLEVSHNHLMKIVPKLRKGGFVESVRGRRGGIQLARDAKGMRMAEVIRHTEPSYVMQDWSRHAASQVSNAVQSATEAFMAALDGYTIADLIPDQPQPAASDNRRMKAIGIRGNPARLS
jgi:Rrf2 family transcriptional regulator, nitric oxide-sensitive transcriptional repressor